jgi:hypothetical protein
MSTTIKKADLQPGDVFLYHGTSFVSRLIRLFDATEYSHASIWTGSQVIEALGDGVNKRSLNASVADCEYVHVYRFRDSAGNGLGAAGLPAAPVITIADQFGANKNRYGYEQILLLALLASARRLAAPIPFLGRILRTLLDNAMDALANLAAAGREPLICSELVFRCFDEAGAAYKVAIRGADMAANFAAGTMAATSFETQPEDDGGFADAAATFLANYSALKPMPPAPVGVGGMVMAVANFVTPGDLSKSPNLQKFGRLLI